MPKLATLFGLLSVSTASVFAGEDGVAVLATASNAAIQSGAEIRRDLLGECITKLPSESQLTATSTANDTYLKRIDGLEKEGWTQVWTASASIGWQVRQRFLYVVATKGLGATAAPQFRKDSAVVFLSERISSDPSESSHFAGIEPRTRYFASAHDAELSARNRAGARLKELRANLCQD